jgi:hypothetical protein
VACATATSASPAALCPCVVWGVERLAQVARASALPRRLHEPNVHSSLCSPCHYGRQRPPPPCVVPSCAPLSLSRCCVRRWVRC